jgi:hypothetical protein
MTKYGELEEATRLMMERDLQSHRRSLQQTRMLQAELDQLDGLRKAAQADSGSITARQILGADVVWQGWLSQKRSQILQSMAAARAQEAFTMDRARIAFSRNEAARSLVEQESKNKRRRRDEAAADTIDALGHLRRAMDRYSE